jgi:hypothetical protein
MIVEVYASSFAEPWVRFIGSDEDCSLSSFAHERHAFGPRIPAPHEAETIYLLTTGSYSDYRVLCATRDQALATAIAAKLDAHPMEYQSGGVAVEAHYLIRVIDEIRPQPIYEVTVDWEGHETLRRSYFAYPWQPGNVSRTIGWGATGVSDRGYDEALKAARDLAATGKARRAGIA